MLFSVTKKRKISQATQLNAPVIFFVGCKAEGHAPSGQHNNWPKNFRVGPQIQKKNEDPLRF
jgi:hypothetical protein